jgi:hypothetical protein
MMKVMKLLDALDHGQENSEMRRDWINRTTHDAQDATVESQR